MPRKRRLSRWLAALLAALTVFSTVAVAIAATTIGTGSSTEYFEFVNNSGNWDGLGTPQHWDNSTGNVAYCLHHQKDSPPSGMTYNEFDPSAIMSSRVQAGIQAILENGYPATTGGFSADQARYATANAIRAWLSENGIGYNFMNLANGNIRAKSGYTSLFSWMTSLVNLARAGSPSSNGTITVSPLSQQWQQSGSSYTASIRVTLSGVSSYSITPPSGVTMSGFTGRSGDNLTFTSNSGAPITLTFDGDTSGGGSVSLYWYQPTNGTYQSVVVVDSSHGGVTVAYAQITLGDQIVTPTPTPTPTVTPTPTPTPEPTYSLTVRKTDSRTGNTLDGAQFELQQNGSTVYLRQTGNGQYEAGGSAGQFTTSGGTATISGLKAGSYTVVEQSAPAGYAVASASKGVAVSGNSSVDVTNDPTELTLIKTDLHSGAAMSGVSFTLKNSTGQTMRFTQSSAGIYAYAASGGTETMTTGVNGKIVIYGLPDGMYTVEEAERVEGYTLMRSKPVTLSGETSIAMTNEPLGIELLKRDEKSKQPMPGVRFQLLDSSGNPVPVKGSGGTYEAFASGNDTITTGADGKVRVLYLAPGTYIVREIAAPNGYAKAPDQTSTVSASNGYSTNPATITIQNTPLGMEFLKLDELTGEPVSGAAFRLLNASGGTVRLSGTAGSYEVSASGSETFTTNSVGIARIDYLPVGSYAIREESAPPGFSKAPDVAFTVTEAHTYKSPVAVSMSDEPLTLDLTKLDDRTGETISGAVFQLLDAQGNAVKLKRQADGSFHPDMSGSDRFTVPESGTARIYYLPVGKYTFREVEAPRGYALADAAAISVAAGDDRGNPAAITVRDEPLMLRIVKKDSLTDKPLGGATFRIVSGNGEAVKLRLDADGAYIADNSGQEAFTTDENGEAVILYLPAGSYRIVETNAPAGYALTKDAAVTMASTHGTSSPQEAIIRDEPTAIEIVKTDKLTGQSLPGAEFHLLGESGEALKFTKKEDGRYHHDPNGTASIVTGADGKAILVYMPVGDYTLREEKAPDGYARTADEVVQLTNRHGLSAPLVFALADDVLSLEIAKADALTEKSMEGVVFTLTRDGEPVKATKQTNGEWHTDPNGTDQLVTDAQGRIVLRYLTPGTYRLTEIAPDGYTQPDPIEIVITEEHGIGAPYKMGIANQPTELQITKTDMATGKAMGDLAFRLLDSGGKIVKLTRQTDGTWHPDPAEAETFTVDAEGKALLRYLPIGSYTVEEVTTPEGYAALAPQKIAIEKGNGTDNPAKLHIQNQPLRLIVEKTDALTGLPVRALSISKYSASTVTTTQTTGETGVIGGGTAAGSGTTTTDATPSQAPTTTTTYSKDGTTADSFTFRLISSDGAVVKLAEKGDYLTPDASGKEQHSVNASGIADILYLPAGSYTVEEVTAPTGYAKEAAVKVEVKSDSGMENAAVARIVDKPLALEISKVRKDNGKPLSGAGFSLAIRGGDTPLTFSLDKTTSYYFYDPAGKETTIKVDKQGKALVAYLPLGTYDLVETVVPFGFFAAPAQTVTIEDKHTMDAPFAIKVENEAAVKLGLDSDKLRLPLALALIFFACVGGTTVFLTVKARKKR